MSLGKNISRLRAEQELSQDDLAAALGVSRQSVSKWETDNSVPELDKLVKLSELFGVSLDELVLDRPAGPDIAPGTAPAAEPTAPARPLSRLQKLVGVLLFFFGGIVILLLTGMGSFLGGLLFASPFLLCGVICLACHRHAGLWCGWAVFFCVDAYLRYATGLSWGWIILAFQGVSMSNPLHLPMAWAELLIMLLLVVLTAVLLRKKPFHFTRRNTALFIAGWAAFLLLPQLDYPMFLALYGLDAPGRALYFFLANALSYLRLALLAALAACSVRALWGKRNDRAG